MKKILAMAMVLVLAFSLCTITVAADADGSYENPWEVNTPMQMPSSITVEAGDTQWYAFNSNFFNGVTLQTDTYALSEIIVDGVSNYPSPALQGAIAFTMTATSLNPIMVGFVNSGDAAVTVYLSEAVADVYGTEELPVELSEGDNTVIMTDDALNTTMGKFFCVFTPTFTTTFTFTVTNTLAGATDIGFDKLYILNAMDYSEIASVSGSEVNGASAVLEVALESWTTVFVVVEYPFSPYPELNVNIAAPAEGSEERPIDAYGTYGIESPFVVPAGEKLYINMMYLDGTTLYSDGDVEVTVGEAAMTEDGVVLEGNSVLVVVTNNGTEEAGVQFWVEYPEGTQQNPQDVELGDTEVAITEEDIANWKSELYFEYTANVDGTLTVTPADSTQIGNIQLENTSIDDYTKKYAEMSPWGFDEEFNYVQTIGTEVSMEVKKGDVIYITVTAAQDENYETLPFATTINVDLPQPKGYIGNPDEVKAGDNAITVPATYDEGYFSLYTATADGKLTVTFGNLEKLEAIALADYDMENVVGGEGVGNGVLTIDVKKGEQYWVAFLPNVAEEIEVNVNLSLEIPAVEDDKTEDKPASPVTGPVTGAGIALIVAAASGAYVFLNKKR